VQVPGDDKVTLNTPSEQFMAGAMTLSGDCSGCGMCIEVCPAAVDATCSLSCIMQNGCICCGRCQSACPRRAISYQDDTALFLEDLSRGTAISLLVAPAVHSHFISSAKLLGYLKQAGVRSIYNVLMYADIAIWAYVEVLRQRPNSGFIASPCAAVSSFVQCHLPRLRQRLMPVLSPLQCTAIFLRKYKKTEEKLAFLSPCIAKRAEMRTVGGSVISYNVTIGRLKQYLSEQDVDLDGCRAFDFDDAAGGNGKTLGFYGGLRESVSPHIPTGRFEKISGPGVYKYLIDYMATTRRIGTLPDLVEAYNCVNPCDGGPGTGLGPATSPSRKRFDAAIPKSAENHREVLEMFRRFDRELDPADFVASY